jgi:hypothetical protein
MSKEAKKPKKIDVGEDDYNNQELKLSNLFKDWS